MVNTAPCRSSQFEAVTVPPWPRCYERWPSRSRCKPALVVGSAAARLDVATSTGCDKADTADHQQWEHEERSAMMTAPLPVLISTIKTPAVRREVRGAVGYLHNRVVSCVVASCFLCGSSDACQRSDGQQCRSDADEYSLHVNISPVFRPGWAAS